MKIASFAAELVMKMRLKVQRVQTILKKKKNTKYTNNIINITLFLSRPKKNKKKKREVVLLCFM